MRFNVVEDIVNEEGFFAIQINEGPYKGVIFHLGKVQLYEEEGEAKLQFHYDIVKGEVEPNDPDMEKYIGDILLEIIDDGLKNNTLVYAGGVDEK